MLSFFKKKSPEGENLFFLINIHIERGTSTEMPANLAGAFVPVFVSATSREEAAQKAVSALTKDGYVFIDIADKKIHQLDPSKWDSYVLDCKSPLNSIHA